MDCFPIISKTSAYKIFAGDIDAGTLSHAYLFISDDNDMVDDYTKVFVKLLANNSSKYDNTTRISKLIDKNAHIDTMFFPKEDKLRKDDIEEILSTVQVKSYEGGRKIYVLNRFNELQGLMQNKLLKTLEEPPEGVTLILSCTNTFSILSTVLSRVKKIEISNFKNDDIKDFLVDNNYNIENIDKVILNADNKVGNAIKLLENDDNTTIQANVYYVLENLKSSRDIHKFLPYISKDNVLEFTNLLLFTILEVLKQKQTNSVAKKNIEISKQYSNGALIYISERVKELLKQKFYNGSYMSIVDGIMFSILEGKHKWQK